MTPTPREGHEYQSVGAGGEARDLRRVPVYRTIVIDPPWPQKGGGPLTGREGFGDTRGSLPMPYRTMSVADIAVLTIPAEPDAHLYLWTTSGFLPDAFRVLDAWGFRYSTTLVWAKAPIGHGLGGAYGIATEFVLFARRGNAPTLGKVGRNWWQWKRPYDERGKPQHSAKPEEFYAMVEQVSPGPYLDMFARRPRLGWDVWGDEAPGSVAWAEAMADPSFVAALTEGLADVKAGRLVPYSDEGPAPFPDSFDGITPA